jgi:hypothetical protein
VGIELADDAFSCRFWNIRSLANDNALRLRNNGGANVFSGFRFNSRGEAAVDVESEDNQFLGGNISGPSSGPAVIDKGGGTVYESIRFEVSSGAVQFGTSSDPGSDITVSKPWVTSANDFLFKWVNGFRSAVINPRSTVATTNGFWFSGGSDVREPVLKITRTDADKTFTNWSNVTTGSIEISGGFTDVNRPSGVESMLGYNYDDGNLNIHNGSEWILPDGTTT